MTFSFLQHYESHTVKSSGKGFAVCWNSLIYNDVVNIAGPLLLSCLVWFVFPKSICGVSTRDLICVAAYFVFLPLCCNVFESVAASLSLNTSPLSIGPDSQTPVSERPRRCVCGQ